MSRLYAIALNTATALATIAAVVAAGIRVKEGLLSKNVAITIPGRVANWRDLAKMGRRIGPLGAPVIVEEFTDYECPFCRDAAVELLEIQQQFPSRVAIVIRHFPLPTHGHANAAAEAAECAGRQGAFEEYHKVLLSSQGDIGRKSWTAFAREAGVSNTDAFESCLSDPAISGIVRADIALGQNLGIKGTPTFLINDLQISGYPGKGRLTDFIRAALEDKRKEAEH